MCPLLTTQNVFISTFDQTMELIRAHPFFPIVKHLFLQCQRALNPENWDEPNLFSVRDAKEMAIQLEAVTIQEKGKKTEENCEMVDELMLEAVVVLRIHLAELHRLSELCEKFVSNYQRRISETLAQQRDLLAEDMEKKIGREK